MAKHRLMMNIDKDLYEWLRDHAHENRSSMSRFITETLEDAKKKIADREREQAIA